MFSWPTWREWWATRTPLPYADQPWRSTCRDQQPVHVQMLVQERKGVFTSLRAPNSNLHGVLWCSGIGVPPSVKVLASAEGGGGGGDVTSGTVQMQQLDGRRDQGRLRLNHWTTIYAVHMAREVMQKTGPVQKMTGQAILVIRPSDSDTVTSLPEFNYDEASNQWNIHEVAP